MARIPRQASPIKLPRWTLVVLLVLPLIVWYIRVSVHNLSGPKTIYIVAQSGPGRLGNQLFQYASVMGIFEDRQRHNPYQDDVTFCIDQDHPFTALEQIFKGPFPACPTTMPPFKHLSERGYGIYTQFDETQYCASASCAFTFGTYLQSYKYLQLAGKSIRSALTLSSNEITQQARDTVYRVRTNPTTAVVGIHVRRSDVLQVDYLQEASVEYLQKAIHHYEAEFGYNVRFLVTSDDIEWCRSQEIFSKAILVDSQNPILDFAILSHCDHYILTVGTFGWWGAWLGMAENVVYNQDAIVLDHATNRGKVRLEDYYPSVWTGMS